MMQVVFITVEFKISNFLLQYNLIEDNHKSPVFSVSGRFFAWELFLVAMYLYVFQINHKRSVPQMGATKITTPALKLQNIERSGYHSRA